MSLLSVVRRLCLTRPCKNLYQATTTVRHKSDVYEPDYLALMIPDIPIYENLVIQMKGYDFPMLENYQKYVHKFAEAMNIEVEECWSVPPQKLHIQTFKPRSSAVEREYDLNVYERNIQICDVPSTSYSILLRLIQDTAPEGVTVNVNNFSPEEQEIRYVPDNTLLALKQQLDEMGGPTKERKKK